MTDLRPLVVELAQLLATIKELGQRADAIKSTLRAELTVGENDFGEHVVNLTPNRRLDPSKVEGDYPPSTHPYLYSLGVDVKKVRSHFEPDDIERYMVPAGVDKITVKPVEEVRDGSTSP